MINFKLKIDINAPREVVANTILNPIHLAHWKVNFFDYEILDGVQGEEGFKLKLIYEIGSKKFEVIETLENIEFPDFITFISEANGGWSRTTNKLIELDENKTQLIMCAEIKCIWLIKLISKIIPNLFTATARKELERLKIVSENNL